MFIPDVTYIALLIVAINNLTLSAAYLDIELRNLHIYDLHVPRSGLVISIKDKLILTFKHF